MLLLNREKKNGCSFFFINASNAKQTCMRFYFKQQEKKMKWNQMENGLVWHGKVSHGMK